MRSVARPLQEPRLYAPVLATYAHALPQALRDTAAPVGATLRLVITGPAGGEWLAVRQPDRWVLGADPTRHADTTATLDQDTAWRLFTKGLPPAAAQRAVALAGDTALASAILGMVAIIA